MNHINYLPFYGRVKKIHFIGIGGIGMSGIAEVLLGLGLEVHGSDLKANPTSNRLADLGAKILIGHNAQNVCDADVVVTSSAISNTNPEVIEAKRKNIVIIPRAKMLAELMRLKYGIAIAGSHGKTTTTSLVAAIMQHANLDPTVVIGGKVNHMGSNARLGQGNFLVAEADESDGSFLHITPNIAAFTNLDKEHLDFWQEGVIKLKKEFTCFANRLPFYGLLVACVDCPNVAAILPKINSRIATYGIESDAEFKAVNIISDGFSTGFEVLKHGKNLGDIRINLAGKHNVLNTLAAIALCDELAVPFEIIATGLKLFTGVQRRFQLIGDQNGICVIDDYGHHPTEIEAVLKSAKDALPNRRLVVLFQPHRYSRTRDLLPEFTHCFNLADELILSDIYAASEKPIEGINASILSQKVAEQGHKNVAFGGSLKESISKILRIAKSGDVIITLGAGSITHAALDILQGL